MSKSHLATETYPAYSGNYTVGRSGRKIEAITIHHMAGKLTAKQCGAIFQTVGRNGSSHYGIGYNGEIASYVDEENTAWTNSNWDSNCKSVTIETSNDENGGDWHVSDASINSLIKLVADIAKRNNLGTLVKGQNVTWHSMFANTNCPGTYLMSKFDYIIAEANKINKRTPTTRYKVGDVVNINGVYVSSTSTEKLKPAITKGTITKIVNARNPYLLDNGNIGWVNDSCIVNAPITKYLNISPTADYRTVYKDSSLRTKAGEIKPKKYGGLSYKILGEYPNQVVKINTTTFGQVYISSKPQYYCTITNTPTYSKGDI